jgi:hypothetical protein
MIHLLVAYQINPTALHPFWIGSIAPDYTDSRQLKDQIHFRNISDRMSVLNQFKTKIDRNNPFACGWLLHLFVDACWDEIMIPTFQQKYIIQDWFIKYRKETALASFYLFHHMDWTCQIWTQILNADLSTGLQNFSVPQYEIERYSAQVYKRHSESKIDSISQEYPEDLLLAFSQSTAQKYKQWIKPTPSKTSN